MKKLIIATGLYFVFLFILEGINITILQQYHSLDFYYTLDGLKTIAMVCGIETAVIVGFTKPYFRWMVGKKEFERMFAGKKEG